nr:hypothetical protein [Tanacetum cinerariifolium]
ATLTLKEVKKAGQTRQVYGKNLEVLLQLDGRAHGVVELDETGEDEDDAKQRPANAGEEAHGKIGAAATWSAGRSRGASAGRRSCIRAMRQ